MDLGLVDSVEDFSLVDGDFGVATADLGGGSGAETWACNDESFEHARTLRRLVAGPCSSTTVLANDGAPVSTTTYAYDGAQRLVSETTAYPDGGNLTYFYLYEDGGGLSELVLVRDDAAVQRTEIEDELDVNRRLLSRTGRSRGVGVDWVTSYFYDESGRILREETDYELNGSVDGWADYRYSESTPLGYSSTAIHNSGARTLRCYSPAGNTVGTKHQHSLSSALSVSTSSFSCWE